MSVEQRDWVEWFEQRTKDGLDSYARSRWAYNAPIWECFYRHFPNGARVLECGCGPGTWTIMLSNFGYVVRGVDIDPDIVALANENAKKLNGNDVRFEVGDIFALEEHYSKYDVAYSSGVLEHFVEDDVVKILREEAKCAEYVFAVVPSKYVWANQVDDQEGYMEPYTIGKLKSAFRRADIEIIDEIAFSSGNKVGAAIEKLAPPIVGGHLFKHFAATIGVLGRSRAF